MKEDTIVALATPPGIGAISVIRVSGTESIKLTDSIFSGKEKLANVEGYSLIYGKVVDDNKLLDDVLVSVFRGSNSYTGEDSVEISTHGSPFIVQRIIQLLINLGVRAAEPGEFTKRSFLNNKIDLAQAEAVADVIQSRTSASLRGARNQLDGLLSSKVAELREKLINISALLELELDFSEEDLEFINRDELDLKISEVLIEIEKLLKTYNFGRITRDGVNVAIVGEPNVGKSSILNYILKESRAIVSSIPGTTRDIIREDISIDGFLFRLYDTAGIRSSEDELEKEGILRSREALKNADIVMFVMDSRTGFSKSIDKEISELNPAVKTIKILNKTDLESGVRLQADFRVSAKTGNGMDKLINGLKESAFGNSFYTEDDVVVSSLRHVNCLENAKGNLIKAKRTSENKLSGEYIASDIRAAENSLLEIVGKIAPDDVLNSIFSKFCIGK
ncbi:MAG: tRNA uridine-5-carboxymethylaminomethyl(34) synthesis GTPase MnmE [Ignavibacteria bacterium]|nr:tRNA uridine-5-carboxymethylaminomethyl(34) synthesis GTPase MnmE [Ignavibacteria bacterium]